ncbi:MAG: MBL fold metallo-hydrolase, partial [Ktedonobacteraceae bacterium]|nr:MBL fold metallo-hydrolase [Ktedonobacteraceae bacterium]
MQTISVETLRSWLDEHRPVSVLDVRPTAERREWAIPGSLHIDAYEALRAHDPAALAALPALNLPPGRPVVAVCGAGKTSLVAAEQLAAQGFEAYSLEGGMRAWSLAWNTAEVPLADADTTVRVIQVRRTGKGCLSYLIGAGVEAFVIDASLNCEVYLKLAAQQAWRITHVFDTHIHADHLSRARELAEWCGAELVLPAQQRVSFPFSPVREGDNFNYGQLHLTALHTPGHTEESTCY